MMTFLDVLIAEESAEHHRQEGGTTLGDPS
jgi:hypothetical protein